MLADLMIRCDHECQLSRNCRILVERAYQLVQREGCHDYLAILPCEVVNTLRWCCATNAGVVAMVIVPVDPILIRC